MTEQRNKPVVVTPTKSVGISLMLTLLFGPIGMLYATVTGAIVMFIVDLVVGILTLGLGLIVTWPLGILWTVLSVNGYNKRLIAQGDKP